MPGLLSFNQAHKDSNVIPPTRPAISQNNLLIFLIMTLKGDQGKVGNFFASFGQELVIVQPANSILKIWLYIKTTYRNETTL